MKELLDKLSSYHLFNYLLPGIVFVVILPRITPYSFLQDNMVVGVFVYYFVGLVISRIGSLLVEPILRKTRFVVFADYRDFVAAEKLDPKIELLSEVNNTYRTLVALFFSLVLVKSYYLLSLRISLISGHNEVIFLTALLVMFLFAYKKQTGYVVKRVKATKP